MSKLFLLVSLAALAVTCAGAAARAVDLVPPRAPWVNLTSPAMLPRKGRVSTIQLSWARRPAEAQMLLAARTSRVREGYVLLFCHLTATGDLTTCRVMSEDPSQGGYGAVSVAPTKKLKVTLPANVVVDPNDEVGFSIGYHRDGHTTICAPPFCVNEGPAPPANQSRQPGSVPVGAY